MRRRCGGRWTRARERNIVIPTFKQMQQPNRAPEASESQA